MGRDTKKRHHGKCGSAAGWFGDGRKCGPEIIRVPEHLPALCQVAFAKAEVAGALCWHAGRFASEVCTLSVCISLYWCILAPLLYTTALTIATVEILVWTIMISWIVSITLLRTFFLKHTYAFFVHRNPFSCMAVCMCEECTSELATDTGLVGGANVKRKRRPAHANVPAHAPVGLSNNRNCCYMNSALQCILSHKSFSELIWAADCDGCGSTAEALSLLTQGRAVHGSVLEMGSMHDAIVADGPAEFSDGTQQCASVFTEWVLQCLPRGGCLWSTGGFGNWWCMHHVNLAGRYDDESFVHHVCTFTDKDGFDLYGSNANSAHTIAQLLQKSTQDLPPGICLNFTKRYLNASSMPSGLKDLHEVHVSISTVTYRCRVKVRSGYS